MRFYLGSSMADAGQARGLADWLEGGGSRCTFRWFDIPDVGETWTDSHRAVVAEREIDGVRRADVVVLLAPGGRGMHAELGAALVLGKRVVLCGRPKFCLFYYHERVTRLDVSWTREEIFEAML